MDRKIIVAVSSRCEYIGKLLEIVVLSRDDVVVGSYHRLLGVGSCSGTHGEGKLVSLLVAAELRECRDAVCMTFEEMHRWTDKVIVEIVIIGEVNAEILEIFESTARVSECLSVVIVVDGLPFCSLGSIVEILKECWLIAFSGEDLC